MLFVMSYDAYETELEPPYNCGPDNQLLLYRDFHKKTSSAASDVCQPRVSSAVPLILVMPLRAFGSQRMFLVSTFCWHLICYFLFTARMAKKGIHTYMIY